MGFFCGISVSHHVFVQPKRSWLRSPHRHKAPGRYLLYKKNSRMKSIFITFSFFLLTNFSFSQIKNKELIGEWYTENELLQYYKKDTILFTQKTKNFDKMECDNIEWKIEKKTFKLSEVNICTAKAKVKKYYATENIKLRKTDFGQVIEYYQNKYLIDKFRIVQLDKNNNSKLTIMRFDKLAEQKLSKYVDSLIVKVLKYNADTNASENNYGVQISDRNPNVKIRIRDGGIENYEPLIVINGYPLENREFLKELLLVETYGITYLNKEKSASIYGSKAVNGVIILQTSEKRFKCVRKKYSR